MVKIWGILWNFLLSSMTATLHTCNDRKNMNRVFQRSFQSFRYLITTCFMTSGAIWTYTYSNNFTKPVELVQRVQVCMCMLEYSHIQAWTKLQFLVFFQAKQRAQTQQEGSVNRCIWEEHDTIWLETPQPTSTLDTQTQNLLEP